MLLALWCVPYQVCPGTGDDHRLGFHCSLPQRRPPGVCIRGQRTVPSAGSVRSRQCRGEGDACTVGQGAAVVCPGILWSVLCRRSWQALAKGRTGRTSPLFATAFFVVRSTEAQPWRVGGSSYADAMSCHRSACVVVRFIGSNRNIWLHRVETHLRHAHGRTLTAKHQIHTCCWVR